MVRVDFKEPTEFEQEGVMQKGMFIECNIVLEMNTNTLIWTSPNDWFMINTEEINK